MPKLYFLQTPVQFLRNIFIQTDFAVLLQTSIFPAMPLRRVFLEIFSFIIKLPPASTLGESRIADSHTAPSHAILQPCVPSLDDRVSIFSRKVSKRSRYLCYFHVIAVWKHGSKWKMVVFKIARGSVWTLVCRSDWFWTSILNRQHLLPPESDGRNWRSSRR